MATVYLVGGIPAQVAAPAVIIAGFLVKPRWLLPLVFLVLVFLAVPVLTGIQRHRLRTTAGVEIPPQPFAGRRLSVPGVVAAVRTKATWRQLGYHLFLAPALAAAAAAALGAWLAGLLYTVAYAYASALPPDGLLYRGRPWVSGNPLRTMGIPDDSWLTAAGVVLLAAAPWMTAGVAALDAAAARALLGPRRAD
jgi:hypothetical protein